MYGCYRVCVLSRMLKLIIVCSVLVGAHGYALSLAMARYVAPCVYNDYVVYSRTDHGHERIRCVDRNSGVVQWNLDKVGSELLILPERPSEVVVIVGTQIQVLSIQTGVPVRRIEIPYQYCTLSSLASSLVLVEGWKGEKSCLALVDTRTERIVWERIGVKRVLARGGYVLLCELENRVLAAISKITGEVV